MLRSGLLDLHAKTNADLHENFTRGASWPKSNYILEEELLNISTQHSELNITLTLGRDYFLQG